MMSGGEPDDVVDARQRAVAEARIVGRQPPPIRLGKDLPGPAAKVGIISVAGDEQQDGGEPVKGVGAREQLHARPVQKVQDAHGLSQQLVFADLEQLVARMVLDDVLEALLVVTAGRRAGAGHDPGHLLADQRHGAGRLVVGVGGEQAHKPDFSAGSPVVAIAFDADVIHVAAPVDAALHIGLGDGERRIAGDAVLDGGHQHRRFVGAAQDRAIRVAQHAQAVAGLVQRLLGCVVAGLQLGVFIVPGAQKHEMLGVKPAQKIKFLGPGFSRRRQLGDRGVHQPKHGGEVVHCGPYVSEGGLDAVDQRAFAIRSDGLEQHGDHRLAAWRAGLRSDAVLIAGCGDDRVEHRADRQALIGDLAHDAVHQERRVVLHDLQPVQRGVDGRGDAQAWCAPTSMLGKAPEIRQVAGQTGGGELGQVVGLGVGLCLPRESGHGVRRRIVGEFGLHGLGQAGPGARRAAHDVFDRMGAAVRSAKSQGPETRTPPEERIRRRVAPPWGGGGTQGARCARGVGERTHPSSGLAVRPTIDRERAFTV